MENNNNHLKIEQLETGNSVPAINEVSFFLDSLIRNDIKYIPWLEYNYKPDVQFAIAYGNGNIYLKYFIKEKFIKATNYKTNGPVWEDSCVEFFISFDDERAYYNFEFNCIGATLAAYGETKENREFLPIDSIRNIKFQCVINNDRIENDFYWEIAVAIPQNIFIYNKADTFKGKKCRGNFYKCGDSLPIPHFISWSAINSAEPNFHLSEFFGALHFV